MKFIVKIFVCAFVLACSVQVFSAAENGLAAREGQKENQAGKTAEAIFAGGCFWCMEPPFDKLEGVLSTISGYSGGKLDNPNYHQVSAGGTGHAEVVKITYEPDKVSYAQLLDVFWRNINPMQSNGQFCDKGDQYRSGIFYKTDKERQLAEASKQALAKSGRFEKPIVTEITKASVFYPAEKYHQNYYRKHPWRYKYYRHGCGRDRFLNRYWNNSPSK